MNQPQEWLTQPGGLADRLAALRNRTGLSGKDFAGRLGWPASKVSRLENGRQMPSAADIDAWVRASDGDGATERELLLLLEEAQAAHRDWRRRMSRGQAAVQRDYNELTRTSSFIRYFETAFVPGYLQTYDYARRIIAEMVDLHGLAIHDIDEAVDTRMQRQRYLYDPAKRFEFLLDEAVLHRQLCPPDTMRAQLDRLQTVIGLPNIKFGIVPFKAPTLPTTPQHKFEIYDDFVVVELFDGELEFSDEEKVAFYVKTLNRLWDEALVGNDARPLILAAAEELRA